MGMLSFIADGGVLNGFNLVQCLYFRTKIDFAPFLKKIYFSCQRVQMSFADQLKALAHRFEHAQPADPESKHAVLAELDHAIVSLRKIRETLAEPCTTDIDAKLHALLSPYNTTVDELVGKGITIPTNCMDVNVYKDSLCRLETQIAETQQLIDKAHSDLGKKQQALKEQLKLLENRSIIFGVVQPINPCEINQYSQAITNTESTIRQYEQTMAQHVAQLWHYVHTIRPIDAKHFKTQFNALVHAKLALAVQAKKAEVDAIQTDGSVSSSSGPNARSNK